MLYLSSVPFMKLGFPELDDKPYPAVSKFALHAVPPAVLAVGAMLGGVYHLLKRKAAMAGGVDAAAVDSHRHHPTFAPLQERLWTPLNRILAVLMGFGLLSLIARFVLGLGGSTNLSDTYAWGLWIVFDLVWIAIAAGAFATAGIIYVFQRKDLYTIGRSAVLMGFLSYSFVTVTLLADLGLPLHSYQLALQAPDASAMFEVSWCVGLYVTVLLLEFLPVPLQYHGFHKAVEVWRRWSGAYVAFAVTLFVYLLSRNLVYAGAAAILFSFTGLCLQGLWPEGRADHAGDCGGHSVHDAPEFARLSFPAHAGQAGATMVVARNAGFVPALRDRGGHSGRDPRGDVHRESLVTAAIP